MSISVLIPCYNEAKNIEACVEAYYREIIEKNEGAEMIVIDDASTDETPRILGELKDRYSALRFIRQSENRGHGQALITGYRAAKKPFVFQVDADNQFDPADFRELDCFRDDTDVLLGYRDKRRDPQIRKLIAAAIRAFVRLYFGVKVRDANCPFRLMKTSVLHELLHKIPQDSLAPNIMLAIAAKKSGLTIREIEVRHFPPTQASSLSSFPRLLAFCWKGLGQLLSFKP